MYSDNYRASTQQSCIGNYDYVQLNVSSLLQFTLLHRVYDVYNVNHLVAYTPAYFASSQ